MVGVCKYVIFFSRHKNFLSFKVLSALLKTLKMTSQIRTWAFAYTKVTFTRHWTDEFSTGWKSGAPYDGFLLNTSKTLFRLSRVLLDLQRCILSGAIKLVSVRSSKGNFSFFEITGASVLFSRRF